MHELNLLLTRRREKGEEASQWVMRIDKGSQQLQYRMGSSNLSDSVYVQLVLRELTQREKNALVEAQVAETTPSTEAHEAMNAIRELEWGKFQKLVNTSILGQPNFDPTRIKRHPRERVSSYDQVQSMIQAALKRRPASGSNSTRGKEKGEEPPTRGRLRVQTRKNGALAAIWVPDLQIYLGELQFRCLAAQRSRHLWCRGPHTHCSKPI